MRTHIARGRRAVRTPRGVYRNVPPYVFVSAADFAAAGFDPDKGFVVQPVDGGIMVLPRAVENDEDAVLRAILTVTAE